MIRLLVSILFFTGIAGKCLAYPITPVPLRQLVAHSEYIIVGYVGKTVDKPSKDDGFGTRIAHISVLENLKGNVSLDTVEVEFDPHMICPAPARYNPGTFVISFLYKDEKTGVFRTCSLSYGVKTGEKADLDAYKARILEMQQILTINDVEKQYTETVEWLVKCAENKATRWEGSSDLLEGEYSWTVDSTEFERGFESGLSVEQKKRLKVALLSSAKNPDFAVVDMLHDGNRAEIDAYLIEGLKVLTEDEYYTADEYMERLKHKAGHYDAAIKLIAKFKDIQYDGEKTEEMKRMIDQFIQEVE